MTRMAVSKVSVSMDEGVLAEARERVGGRGLSSYVNDAVRRQLQHDRVADLLAQMDAESGPVSAELLEEARRQWRGDAVDR
jgi:Arc/MetJ family transcription regulator